jgi:glucose/arabinose dehydrogenase
MVESNQLLNRLECLIVCLVKKVMSGFANRFVQFLGVALVIVASVQPSMARDEFRGWWLEEYGTQSTSGDAVCQLCHERGGGGDGWNSYGWLVRGIFRNSGDISDIEERLKASLNEAEGYPTDPNDAGSPTFLQEILANAQPGWRQASDNEIRYDDETKKFISPPASLPCALLIDEGDTELTCSTDNPIPTSIVTGANVKLKTVASGFTAPVSAVAAPGEPESIYVVEQGGKVWRVNLASGAKQLFLDLSHRLVSNYGNPIPGFPGYDERGLLGFAFHPAYASNRKIITYISEDYVADRAHFSTMPVGQDPDHQSVITEWVVNNPLSVSPSLMSERTLMVVDQPQHNHNGGMVTFGPDGYLYIAFGDGGERNDAGVGHGDDGNGQDNDTILGTIARINSDAVTPLNGRYAIPASNPFASGGGLAEAYVYGLRNPYRFAVESRSGGEFDLYIGDVGQDAIEEVNRVSSSNAGVNLGWNHKEGSFYFSVIDGTSYVSSEPPFGVTLPPMQDPIVEYDHEEGISVIGGFVYRGTAISSLKDKYVFADWGRGFANNGRLFMVTTSEQLREVRVAGGVKIHITGFGQDHNRELYVVGSPDFVVSANTGLLQRLEPDEDMCLPIKTRIDTLALVCL